MVTGNELRAGQVVWTRKLEPVPVRGDEGRRRYGRQGGIEFRPRRLRVRHAAQGFTCSECGAAIALGELHGSAFYDHYCLRCCSEQRPPGRFEPSDAP